jgi:hypothetical protein
MTLPAKTPMELIRLHGAPYYVKVDVEHYDAVILRELFQSDIRPPYISAESHTVDVFAWLVAVGGYRSFNLVNGPTIETDYAYHTIRTCAGREQYSFPRHSAGPFRDDIKGCWMEPDNFFKVLALAGLGWKDIHATTEIEADPQCNASLRLRENRPELANALKKVIPARLMPLARKIRSLL